MKDFNEFTTNKLNEETVDDDAIKSVDDATDSKEDLESTEEESNEESNEDNCLHKALSCLFLSRTQTHYYHFQTESFAEHKALNEYYDSLLLLADELIEVGQGEFGRVKGKIEITIEDYDKDSMMDHFKETLECIRECQDDNDNAALASIYDEIETLIMKTQYLLSLK